MMLHTDKDRHDAHQTGINCCFSRLRPFFEFLICCISFTHRFIEQRGSNHLNDWSQRNQLPLSLSGLFFFSTLTVTFDLLVYINSRVVLQVSKLWCLCTGSCRCSQMTWLSKDSVSIQIKTRIFNCTEGSFSCSSASLKRDVEKQF